MDNMCKETSCKEKIGMVLVYQLNSKNCNIGFTKN